MHLVWWHWICLGVFLLFAELTTPGGFYLLFIGIAALIVGGAALLVPASWMQLLIFAGLSIALITLLRKPLVQRVHKATPHADGPEFIGETARAVEAIAVGKEGTIEMRGTTWQARNAGSTDIQIGNDCIIVSRDGLTLTTKLKQ